MKNKLRLERLSVFLISIMFLCLFSTNASAQSETKEQSTPMLSPDTYADIQMEDSTDQIEVITQLIVMYSEQLEEYDRSNGIFVVACISFIGVILGVVVTLLTSKEHEVERPNFALSMLFVTLPAVMTLCLYVFSMQCRRVEFFRGYLSYLEGILSDLTGVPMIFNSEIVPKFFGEFTTNTWGPFVMGVFVVIFFVVSGYLCLYYARQPKTAAKKSLGPKRLSLSWKKFASIVLLIVVFAVCIVFCGVCVNDLVTNVEARDAVYNYCMNSLAEAAAQ